MKQVYIYSQNQLDLKMQCNTFPDPVGLNYINDVIFTQQQSFEDDESDYFNKMNGQDDNILIHVSENLPLDKIHFKLFGRNKADTTKENYKHIHMSSSF